MSQGQADGAPPTEFERLCDPDVSVAGIDRPGWVDAERARRIAERQRRTAASVASADARESYTSETLPLIERVAIAQHIIENVDGDPFLKAVAFLASLVPDPVASTEP